MLEDPKINSPKLLLGTKIFNENVYKSSQNSPESMSPTEDSEYLHFFSPSMWPSDAHSPELTPARESLDNETVPNSASNQARDE